MAGDAPADNAVEQLLAELVEVGLTGRRSRRVRIAVTTAEYLLVREHLLEREGRFYGRVRNVPLVIDENATSPAFVIELAEGEAR
jgi:hypothetical protein